MKERVVFDTNVVVSALLFEGRISAGLRNSWTQCQPVGNVPTIDELNTVLRYPKFKLTETEAMEVLGDYLPFVEIIKGRRRSPLVCRDPDDQKFLDLAAAAKASILVTGDRDLLVLAAESLGLRICTPKDFLAG